MIDLKDIEVEKQIHYMHIRTGDKAVGHVQAIDEEDMMIKIGRPPIEQGDSESIRNYYKTKNVGSWYKLEELELL